MPPQADKHSKTEAPTGYKLGKAREQGQVAKSQDLSATVAMIAGLIAITIFLPKIALGFRNFFVDLMQNYRFENISAGNIDQMFFFTIKTIGMMVLPIISIIWLACFVASTIQVGFHISTGVLTPNFGKLNPVDGFKNLLSFKSLVKTSISLFKMIFVATVAGSVLWSDNNLFVLFGIGDMNILLVKAGAMLWDIIIKASIILLIMAIIDYVYQKWSFTESMRMTKEEVKEEHKLLEGNPTIKGKIKSIQRQAAAKRGLKQSVAEADVVVVNPFHIAVALRYNRDKGDSAPIVVAKGARLLAQRIKEFAREAKVEIIQNIPLARALYKKSAVGLQISPDLYIAVAEVLAIVFKKREKKN